MSTKKHITSWRFLSRYFHIQSCEVPNIEAIKLFSVVHEQWVCWSLKPRVYTHTVSKIRCIFCIAKSCSYVKELTCMNLNDFISKNGSLNSQRKKIVHCEFDSALGVVDKQQTISRCSTQTASWKPHWGFCWKWETNVKNVLVGSFIYLCEKKLFITNEVRHTRGKESKGYNRYQTIN